MLYLIDKDMCTVLVYSSDKNAGQHIIIKNYCHSYFEGRNMNVLSEEELEKVASEELGEDKQRLKVTKIPSYILHTFTYN